MDFIWLLVLILLLAFFAGLAFAGWIFISKIGGKQIVANNISKGKKYTAYALLALLTSIILWAVSGLIGDLFEAIYTTVEEWRKETSDLLVFVIFLLVVWVVAAVFIKNWRDSLRRFLPAIVVAGAALWFFGDPTEELISTKAPATTACMERVSTTPGTYFEFKPGCRVAFNASQLGVATLEPGIQSGALYQGRMEHGVAVFTPNEGVFDLHGPVIPMVVLPFNATDEQLEEYRAIARSNREPSSSNIAAVLATAR